MKRIHREFERDRHGRRAYKNRWLALDVDLMDRLGRRMPLRKWVCVDKLERRIIGFARTLQEIIDWAESDNPSGVLNPVEFLQCNACKHTDEAGKFTIHGRQRCLECGGNVCSPVPEARCDGCYWYSDKASLCDHPCKRMDGWWDLPISACFRPRRPGRGGCDG